MTPQRLGAALLASVAMVGAAGAVWAYDTFGPEPRIVFYPYLPSFEPTGHVLAAGLAGLALGADARMRLFPGEPRYSARRLAVGCLVLGIAGALVGGFAALAAHVSAAGASMATVLAFAVLGGGCGGLATFRTTESAARSKLPFPAARVGALCLVAFWVAASKRDTFPLGGTVAERQEWTNEHVREYAGLVRVASNVREIVADVGAVVAVAPTSTDRHVFARTMDGDDMKFTLDVVGEKGRGLLRAHATLSEGQIVRWDEGLWTFDGRNRPIVVAASRR